MRGGVSREVGEIREKGLYQIVKTGPRLGCTKGPTVRHHDTTEFTHMESGGRGKPPGCGTDPIGAGE